jgi:hypothetical protein
MSVPTMTIEQWRENSQELIAECAKYDTWRERAKLRLLSDIAPRIGKLSQQAYMGSGFHYYFERQLGRLLGELAMPIQWAANWCAKIPADRLRILQLQVHVEYLIVLVVAVEKSVQEPS